jgi:hypothetical protein
LPLLAQAQVGIVRTVEGQVRVFSAKAECAPRYGLDVDEGDIVRTGDKAWALLTMMDGSKITVRPDTELRVDVYRFTEAGESAQNRAQLMLLRGAVRVTPGRIAKGRNAGFDVNMPDATMTLRGEDQDVTYIVPQVSTRGDALAGAYGKSYAGEAVMKTAGGSVTIKPGQVAFAETKVRKPPQVLTADPYVYHWHSYIDRRAAVIEEKLAADLR